MEKKKKTLPPLLEFKGSQQRVTLYNIFFFFCLYHPQQLQHLMNDGKYLALSGLFFVSGVLGGASKCFVRSS